MSSVSLIEFPEPLGPDKVPLCELDGKVHCSTPDFLNLNLYTNSVVNHPKIVIIKDAIHHSNAKIFPGQVFLPGPDSLFYLIQDAWYENGLERVFEVLENRSYPIVKTIAKCLLVVHRTASAIINKFSSTKFEDFKHNELRKGSDIVICMAWHPHITKLAVATKDDTVTIYTEGSNISTVLKAKSQRRITDISWRPLTSGELAVACSEGVYIWTLDPNSMLTRPSFSSATLLPDPYVCSIAWSPQGDIIVTCNGRDSSINIWEPERKKCLPIKRGGRGGVFHLSWSGDSTKLLAGTVTRLFRVWDCTEWTYENWLTVDGSVTNSAWSEDGTALLFSTSKEHCLYYLPPVSTFLNSESRTSFLVADFTRIQSGPYIVGGEVKGIAWDIRNKHLAVIFHDCQVVALFFTNLSPTFQIMPGFFITGLPNEYPTYICFQKNFTEGVNLTICWSSGRMQYFPMIFSASQRQSRKSLAFDKTCDATGEFISFS